MSLGILTNVAATYAENNLNQTQGSLQTVLQQLSSGSRINSGADDAAGLSVADGLKANEAALNQSAQNAQNGVGLLQTADGALSQVTSLLDRATTLATEASNGGLTTAQLTAADTEFQSIVTRDRQHRRQDELQQHERLFSDGDQLRGYRRYHSGNDDDCNHDRCFELHEHRWSWTFSAADALTSAASAGTTLTDVTNAIADISTQRGTIGAGINQLSAAANVASSESVNLSSAESSIRSTNYGQATSDLAKFQVLSQTGISALAQANSVQQEILKLLQ